MAVAGFSFDIMQDLCWWRICAANFNFGIRVHAAQRGSASELTTAAIPRQIWNPAELNFISECSMVWILHLMAIYMKSHFFCLQKDSKLFWSVKSGLNWLSLTCNTCETSRATWPSNLLNAKIYWYWFIIMITKKRFQSFANNLECFSWNKYTNKILLKSAIIPKT